MLGSLRGGDIVRHSGASQSRHVRTPFASMPETQVARSRTGPHAGKRAVWDEVAGEDADHGGGSCQHNDAKANGDGLAGAVV